MKAYKEYMDKITVSDALHKKIVSCALHRESASRAAKGKPFHRINIARRYTAALVCLAVVIPGVAAASYLLSRPDRWNACSRNRFVYFTARFGCLTFRFIRFTAGTVRYTARFVGFPAGFIRCGRKSVRYSTRFSRFTFRPGCFTTGQRHTHVRRVTHIHPVFQ
jgi:hypothetical protein